jgi:dTDP-4-amino-4,6-dideoxygalactose transaminase
MHPILFNIFILPLYNVLKIGRIILAASVKLNILSKAVTSNECKGKLPNYFPERLPNSLAKLANHQFNKLEKLNNHRIKISKYYNEKIGGVFDIKEGAVYMKYPILIKNPNQQLDKMKKNGIFLNDGWREGIIVPPQTDINIMHYKNDCKNAEKLTKEILILPTHINISIKDADKIINLLKQ